VEGDGTDGTHGTRAVRQIRVSGWEWVWLGEGVRRGWRFYGGYWGPVILWMALIFWGSTDALSANQTSRFLGPFLRWLVPGISSEAEGRVRFVIRKGGHVSEYAVLALLLARALRSGAGPGSPRGHRVWVWGAWGLATAYAFTDEFHQSFHASRQGSLIDVGIDSMGAAVGVLVFVWGLGWWTRRRRGVGSTDRAPMSSSS